MFQDNQSKMRLMINGKRSTNKRTKHMNVRYFCMTDVIKCGDMSVEYFSTGDIWTDGLDKPLQGQAFCKMCNKLVNMAEVYVEGETPTTSSSVPKSTGV